MLALQQQKGSDMKTTIAVLWIGKQTAIAANVGDSRIYQFRGGKCVAVALGGFLVLSPVELLIALALAILLIAITRMVSVGFRSGSMDIVMKQIAERYERDTDRKIYSIISVLEPTLVIILSLIVGMILLSVILPLMGIMSSIG